MAAVVMALRAALVAEAAFRRVDPVSTSGPGGMAITTPAIARRPGPGAPRGRRGAGGPRARWGPAGQWGRPAPAGPRRGGARPPAAWAGRPGARCAGCGFP